MDIKVSVHVNTGPNPSYPSPSELPY